MDELNRQWRTSSGITVHWLKRPMDIFFLHRPRDLRESIAYRQKMLEFIRFIVALTYIIASFVVIKRGSLQLQYPKRFDGWAPHFSSASPLRNLCLFFFVCPVSSWSLFCISFTIRRSLVHLFKILLLSCSPIWFNLGSSFLNLIVACPLFSDRLDTNFSYVLRFPFIRPLLHLSSFVHLH